MLTYTGICATLFKNGALPTVRHCCIFDATASKTTAPEGANSVISTQSSGAAVVTDEQCVKEGNSQFDRMDSTTSSLTAKSTNADGWPPKFPRRAKVGLGVGLGLIGLLVIVALIFLYFVYRRAPRKRKPSEPLDKFRSQSGRDSNGATHPHDAQQEF
jgi:hypothetical protein